MLSWAEQSFIVRTWGTEAKRSHDGPMLCVEGLYLFH